MQKKTDKFFDKIVKKNYNNELEEVLEKKYFDENVKNLLLTILYKIETAYKDYELVKQNVESKEEFIEGIIKNIELNCEEIKLVRPHSEECKIIGDKTFLVEKNKKRIICYPIERKLLYSISKISKNKKIIKDKYFLINKTLSNLINVGNNIDTVEPMRDFNGYSWSTTSREIESIKHNLIYQNLRILVGYKFLNDWINNNEYIIDYMELFQNKLEEKYGEEIEKDFIETIKKLSILIDIKFDKKSKEDIKKIKKEVEKSLEQINNNNEFIIEATNKKRELTQEIKHIDETVNNRHMLQEEYEKRNENLELEQKIFSIRILSQMMLKEREEKIEKIEKINELLNPIKFVKYKKKLEEKEKYLVLIDTKDIEKDINDLTIKLQKIFLKCFKRKISKIETKQDVIKAIYEFRYYCMLPYDEEKDINQLELIEKELDEIGKTIIKQAHKLKVIEQFSKDENIDYKLLKNIFNIRVINLEELNIKLEKEKEKYYIQLFDENAFEEKVEIQDMGNINKKDLEIKLNKKTKIFN